MVAVGRARLTRAAEAVVAVGAIGAVAATAHTAVNLRLLRTPSSSPPPVRERVSVLVPARDEAGRIGPCIASLLESGGLPDVEVLVLDDGSSDGTADVVLRVAAGDPRLRVIDGGGAAVPEGWLGKTWACHRLAEQATGSVLVFVDADVRLSPQGIAASVALLRSAGLDLVCPYPRQLADGALPRLVQPLLQWSWATTLPLRAAETSPRESLAAANGQLLVVDRDAYDRAGGHAAVRGEVLDDVALLRAVKRSGGRGVVADGTDVAVCRMYDSSEQLVEGYTKSLWSAFGSPAGAAGVVGALSWLYVVPAAAAAAGPTPASRRWGAVGYAAGVAGRVLVARRTGGRAVDSLAHPASVAAFGVLVAESLRRKRSGALTWRGRSLPPA
ncbi:MAG: glycosyltransferase family 2 protein [Candidatus Nanopelagicales bacterium]